VLSDVTYTVSSLSSVVMQMAKCSAAAKLLFPKLVHIRGTTSVLWEDERR